MKIEISNKTGVPIQQDMIGLFFEDINYGADGGLYAEMIENRSFEFLMAQGERGDYYTRHDGGYGWSMYPENADANMTIVSGSPLSEENPHYLRFEARAEGSGFSNKAYDGVYLKKDMEYRIQFFARCVRYTGSFHVMIEKDGRIITQANVNATAETEMTYNRFGRYQLTMRAGEAIAGGKFIISLSEPGVVEFDYISMIPADAVAGVFRKDLFERLKELKPGFLRFPGGCIIEGNTLSNRYRYKDTLKAPWDRKNNWNRWAVHNNNEENNYTGKYAHYNQSYGLGYYEYFLLCELIGAKAIPVLNVGLACQYQSKEMVSEESPAFQEFLQDARDLIEFAKGGTDTCYGAVRADLGHPEPFALEMIGIGNEQWQTQEVDFFRRYTLFEEAIHKLAPGMKLIGSAGPDITSEKYELAWDFYHRMEAKEDFVYAVDEHYYVKPEWLYDHVDFYDEYSRKTKVFSGEYAAHPTGASNGPQANTLEGALAEAAFLTGVERNADVVVLASYAPLFARVGYSQWAPDLIWFDSESSFGTPSYYVQKMYANHMGTVTLDTGGKEKEAARKGIYYSLSLMEESKEIIVKIVNANADKVLINLKPDEEWGKWEEYQAQILTGSGKDDYNSQEMPEKIAPFTCAGKVEDEVELPPLSFTVLRIPFQQYSS